MKIYLNAGHGGKDSGATYKGRYESHDTLRLALAVEPLLKAAGHEVVMSRRDDTYTSVARIAEKANASQADLFVALHRNSYNEVSTGIECLVASTASADARRLAQAIQSRLCAVGGRDRGVVVQDARTYVLQHTRMPAVTVELLFLSNPADNALFDRKFSQYAQAVADGICAVAGGAASGGENPPQTPADPPPLQSGMRGEEVRRLQGELNAAGFACGEADGIFGARTKKALVALQKAMGLLADGVYGPRSRAALCALLQGVPPAASMPSVQRGDRGQAVCILQRRLGGLTVDGVFGARTEAATRDFQRESGLQADGIVGPKTWKALGE